MSRSQACEKSCYFATQSCIQGTCVSNDEPGYDGTWACGAQHTLAGDAGYFCDGKKLTSCNVTGPGAVVVATCSDAVTNRGVASRPGTRPVADIDAPAAVAIAWQSASDAINPP